MLSTHTGIQRLVNISRDRHTLTLEPQASEMTVAATTEIKRTCFGCRLDRMAIIALASGCKDTSHPTRT